jgi:hypothetical protein
MQFGHLRAGSDDGNGVNLVGGKLREMFRDLSGSTRPSAFLPQLLMDLSLLSRLS